jgi:hypothetical protein
LSGCSDVIHIEGIAGYGKDWVKKYGHCPSEIPARSWNIDCLKKSGLLRLWCSRFSLEAGAALSSFEVYSVPAESSIKVGSQQQLTRKARRKAK